MFPALDLKIITNPVNYLETADTCTVGSTVDGLQQIVICLRHPPPQQHQPVVSGLVGFEKVTGTTHTRQNVLGKI